MSVLSLLAASTTDAGDRTENQDSSAILADGRVCLVADGMGGQAGGGHASTLVVQAVKAAVSDGRLDPTAQPSTLQTALLAVAVQANADVMRDARRRPDLTGMGSTITLVAVGPQDAYFVHIGDTRLYHWRAGQIQQLTRDDTSAQDLIESGRLTPDEAPRHHSSSLLVKYLGTQRTLLPALGQQSLLPGDRLLLTSDGLHGTLPMATICEVLGSNATPIAVSQQLIELARQVPSTELDNLTALVVQID